MSSRLHGVSKIGLLACMLAQAGCYYQVVDPKTGAAYYTQKWVAADGYHGPLTFTDHSGRTVSLRASRVNRIPRDDYFDATGIAKDKSRPDEPATQPES